MATHSKIKRQIDMTLDESPRSKGVQYATGEEQRAITNNSRKNKVTGTKQKWCSVVDICGDESKVWSYKEEYHIGTWTVRSMNQGKLEVIKQEMARLNINILELVS